MTNEAFVQMIRDEYGILTEDEGITQINTMEKQEYSMLDMREDEMSFSQLMWLCSKPAVGFTGKQKYLSNDYIAPMEIKGHWFLTATHAICYYRCKYAEDAAKYEAGSPNAIDSAEDAIRASKKDISRSNWNDIKERFYHAILDAKFHQNPELARDLIHEDGVFRCSEKEGGKEMAMALTKVMMNLKAEDEKFYAETLRHKF